MKNIVRNNHLMFFVSLSLLFLFFSSIVSASCIEEWTSGSGSTRKVQQQKCGDHTGGEWWYKDGNTGDLVIKPGDKDDSHLFYRGTTGNIPRYFRKGNDVYWVDVDQEDGCHFSSGDTSGMGLFLTTPTCWFMSKIKNKFTFLKISSSGNNFHTFSQSQKTNEKFANHILIDYSTDKVYVYSPGGERIEGADPQTFHVLIPHNDFDGVNIRDMAFDSHHVYRENEIVAYENWEKMKVIPIKILKPSERKNSIYFIKASKDKAYVFSDSGYTVWNNINTEKMHCHIEYAYESVFYCIIDGKTFKASGSYSGDKLKLNSFP